MSGLHKMKDELMGEKLKKQSSGRSLKSIISALALGFVASSLINSLIGHAWPILILNENQVLYLFSTSSQVLAAIYGLTLTGLVFFINELNREQTEDDTREASTRELKNRYYKFLLFITISVGITIALSNVALSIEATGPRWLITTIINTGQSAFTFSLLGVSIFIFEVIDPQAIERASERVKQKYDPKATEDAKGSLEEFMKNFNQIEVILGKYGEPYQYKTNQFTFSPSTDIDNQQRPRRRLSNGRLAEILLRNEIININLYDNIRELISIRNSIVHGADPTVSQSIVIESIAVLEQLKRALKIQ